MTQEQAEQFRAVAEPLNQWLRTHCHPHVVAIVEPDRAELLEGLCNTGLLPWAEVGQETLGAKVVRLTQELALMRAVYETREEPPPPTPEERETSRRIAVEVGEKLLRDSPLDNVLKRAESCAAQLGAALRPFANQKECEDGFLIDDENGHDCWEMTAILKARTALSAYEKERL